MKLLLINPNRYRTPPVIPLGLEYIATTVSNSRHTCRIIDLCFSDKPIGFITRALNKYKPEAVGITLRNIDTVIFDNNVFFLEEIRSYVEHIKKRRIPVIVGGAGFSFMPDAILDYLGADWGIDGPGESAIVDLLDRMEAYRYSMGGVFNGWHCCFDPDLVVERGKYIDYKRYIAEGGIAGFQTQIGCRERCAFCSEGNGIVWFRNPEAIISELQGLVVRFGITTFHLCDTEFNQNLDFCKSFLTRLIDHGPSITWTAYMKASPSDSELFRLLKQSGVNLITLSLPSGPDSYEHAGEISRLAKDNGIRLAVDLLVGLPGDTRETVERVFDRMREIAPDTVGVNSTIRLYPKCAVTRVILDSPEHRQHLLGAVNNNPDLIYPVFYRSFTVDMLEEIIGGDPLFKIEGFERTSNYQRLGE